MGSSSSVTSSTWRDSDRPHLRPVNIAPTSEGDQNVSYVVTDAQQLAHGALTVSPPVLLILSLLDGRRTLAEVCDEFSQQAGQPLDQGALHRVLDYLHQALLLQGNQFEQHYASLVREYQESPVRLLRDHEVYGTPGELSRTFDAILDGCNPSPPSFHVTGLIAPHLDYPRGSPCYGAAYGAIRHRTAPQRVVILGTNHFGRSRSVCATGKDFATPLGTVRCDIELLASLEAQCGQLREFELDHAREHSVELQVLWLQHLFGSDTFRLTALLCPDPCGPTGTQPDDGRGIGLDRFAAELRHIVAENGVDTLFIAGADLSHVGTFFGEPPPLSESLLDGLRDQDGLVLDTVDRGDAEGLRNLVAREDNSTHICSVGCIYTLLSALMPKQITRLAYHQAVTWEIDNCVTGAAYAMGG